MRIVICDVSQDDRQTLRDAIRALRADDDVFEQYASAEELLQQVSSLRSCDALFLDIFMHQSTGMDAAHQLRRLHVDIPIVFLTSSPDFALDGFDVDALDYLMKPVDRKRLEKVLLRIVRRRSTGPSYIYRKNSEIRCIPYRDIVFVESRDHRVFLHLAGETIDILTKIDDIVPEGEAASFLRCHKSYLVNMSHVVRFGDFFEMDTGERVPVRKKDKKQISEAYYDWLTQEAFH